MRILIAPDKFKDALTAMEAAKAIEEGILTALPHAETILLPLADGGDGTAELLTRLAGGRMQKARALNPVLDQISCSWGYAPHKKAAFIELAEASGLRLLQEHQRNPLLTSTFGTGELILAALKKGAKTLIIGLGGSATNDGGAGMAAALGYRFIDSKGIEIKYPQGKDLRFIQHIEKSTINPALLGNDITVRAACDVTNPLLGPNGATYTYAKQKGASDKVLPELEEGLGNLARVIEKDLNKRVNEKPGSGAAGGAGAGVLAFLNGELCSGADLILQYTGFMEKIRNVDLLITGEGKLDATSLKGKVVGKLSQIARQANVPVAVFCGTSALSPGEIRLSDLEEVIEISNHEKNLSIALQNTALYLKEAAKHFIKTCQYNK